MTDSTIGPASNLSLINIFWVKITKGTIRSVDALIQRVHIMVQTGNQRARSACLCTPVCVCVSHTEWPKFEHCPCKKLVFSSALTTAQNENNNNNNNQN